MWTTMRMWMLATAALLLTAGTSTTSDCPTGCTCRPTDSSDNDIDVTVRCATFPSSLPDRANLTVDGANTTIATLQASNLRGVRNAWALHLVDLDIASLDVNPSAVTLTNLRWLSLAKNRLVRIGAEAFRWCPGLELLDLSHNRLKNVSDSTFDGVANLKRLSLANNLLGNIEPRALPATLTWLDLRHNLLDDPNRLPPTADGRFARLEYLDLCGNNLPSYVVAPNRAPHLASLCLGDEMDNILVDKATADGDLDFVTSLTVVAKTENGSESMLRTITRLRQLRSLRLSNFHLDGITLQAVSGFSRLAELRLTNVDTVTGFDDAALTALAPTLRVLDLGRSVVLARSLLSPSTFNASGVPLPELQFLSIAGTSTTDVPAGWLSWYAPNLTELDLGSNPLICDSSLSEIMAAVVAGRLRLAGGAGCAAPPDVIGLPLTHPRVVLRVLADQPNDGLPGFLDSLGVSRTHLFYLAVGLAVLSLILLMGLLVTCHMRRTRGGRREDGRRAGCCGSAGGSDGSGEGFMMRADSEYTFDNFTLSDTLSESRRAAAAASRDSTLSKGRKHSSRK